MDQTGSAVAAATVSLRNQATNQMRTISATQGSFRAGELPVGQYEIRVLSPGFSPYVNNAILISIGMAIRLTVRLAPATVQQQITVSEQPPPIDPPRPPKQQQSVMNELKNRPLSAEITSTSCFWQLN